MSASDSHSVAILPKKYGKHSIPVTKRGLRLGSGLILFVFVVTHLANHALGLISLEAMETGRNYFLLLWRNPVGSTLFLGSLAVHMGFALHSLYSRRRLKMRFGEAAQLILGFAAPVLLISHILGTRAAVELYGTDDTYTYVLLALWVDSPTHGLRQVAATLIVWTHACIGIYYWLRLKPWFARIVPALYGMALMVPVLGLLGFVSAGRTVGRMAEADPGFRLDTAIDTNAPAASQVAYLHQLESWLLLGLGAAVLLTLVAQFSKPVSCMIFPMPLFVADGGDARPAACGSMAPSRTSPIPMNPNRKSSDGSVQHPMCASPARHVPLKICRSLPFCRQMPARGTALQNQPPCRARNRKSPFCSLISAASRPLPSKSFPMTWCLS